MKWGKKMDKTKDTSSKNSFKIIGANVTSILGNRIFDYANTILISSMGKDSIYYLSFYQNAETIISLFFNIIGGGVSDRYSNKKKLIIATDIMSAIACIVLFLFYKSKIALFILIFTNMILAIMSSFNYPTHISLSKLSMDKEYLSTHNSHLYSARETINMASPIIGIIIMSIFSIDTAYVFNILTFFMSAFLVSRVSVPEEILIPDDKENHQEKFKQVLLDGMKYIRKNSKIVNLLLLAAAVNFFLGGYNVILPFTNDMMVLKNFFGMALTAEAIGGILAGLINVKTKRKKEIVLENQLLYSGIALLFFSLLLISNINAIFALICIFGFGFFLTSFNINFSTIVQVTVDSEFIGRVISIVSVVALSVMPLGSLFCAFIYSLIGKFVFFIITLGVIMASVIYIIKNKYSSSS